MNKDTPQSYEYHSHTSHTHCWQDENPPCGIKGKHRCCLCELPAPQSNTDWRTRLAYLKDFPISPDPECTVSVFEDVEHSISQLLEAEKKRWREEVKKQIRALPSFTDCDNHLDRDEVLQKLS